MMNVYDKDYLYHSQKNFGHMVDFAVNTCDYDIDDFFNMFLASNVCVQFENGNPAYIAGKTGCELVRLIVSEIKDSDYRKDLKNKYAIVMNQAKNPALMMKA